MSEQENQKVEQSNNQTTGNQFENWKKFKAEAALARQEAVDYVALQPGDKTIVEVLLHKGVTVDEIEGQKEKYKKVRYNVINLTTGKELKLYLTNKQSGQIDDEIEKLVTRGLKPIIRLKKIDDRTLDIEGVEEQQ